MPQHRLPTPDQTGSPSGPEGPYKNTSDNKQRMSEGKAPLEGTGSRSSYTMKAKTRKDRSKKWPNQNIAVETASKRIMKILDSNPAK